MKPTFDVTQEKADSHGDTPQKKVTDGKRKLNKDKKSKKGKASTKQEQKKEKNASD